MSIKRKLMLIGICVVIIIAVFTANVIRRLREDDQGKKEDIVVKENVITRAEAYRLLSYLEYDKTERENLPVGITYSDNDMSDWYDTYINAVWKMGLIEGNVTIAPNEALTYGTGKKLFDNLIIMYPVFQNVYDGLSFDFMKADEAMLLPHFLEMYEKILALIPEEKRPVQEKTLFVLGKEDSDSSNSRLVTDQGKYYYKYAKSYETFYEEMIKEGVYKTEASIDNDDASNTSLEDGIAIDDSDKNTTVRSTEENDSDESMGEKVAPRNTDFIRLYLDKGINAYVCGQELLYVKSITENKITLHNVWIEKGEDLTVKTFINDLHKDFEAKLRLSTKIEKVIGDITIENQQIVQISVKPDKIRGKVLLTEEDFIEIDGYGKIPLDENYRIYKIYGTLSTEPTSSILVGYETTDFIVSEGRISAALITESIKAENIRVLLKTTKFRNIYHEKVELTATSDFVISSKDKEKTYAAGDKVTITPGDSLLSEGRIKINPVSDDGKVQLLSIKRSEDNPKYRGTIEISEGEEGLLVVNELPLEEYLYSVIPSEMPTYYGIEPLKVQAVCARSYAYKHLMANSLNEYGAHVDDSVNYQVYNNIAENEDSILAVKDTYGKVIEYEGEVITAYYFSTSCGHTTEPKSVWTNDVSFPYLKGRLLVAEAGQGADSDDENLDTYQDLSIEKSFRSFIKDSNFPTYDSSFQWYRWKVTIEASDIKKVIDANLANRYNANPDKILTMTGKAKDGKESVYESVPVDSVGDIVDISVLKRDNGGIITELLITGNKKTIKVQSEYNIRALLAPVYDTLIRQDESKVEGLSLLPSAFFIVDRNEKNGKIKSFTLTGGGYGHGVGMSQNGVKALADTGKEYEEIVQYFYEGTDLGFIYE